MSLLQKGVTSHTSLANKEPAGVIDHADLSVTDTKLASGVGLGDGQLCKLPAAPDGKVLGRSGGAWTAVDMSGSTARVSANPPPRIHLTLVDPILNVDTGSPRLVNSTHPNPALSLEVA